MSHVFNTRPLWKAAITASFIPALTAPVLWYFIVIGKLPSLFALPFISLWALVIGFPVCFLTSYPLLLYLEKINLNKPIVVSTLGGVVAFILALIVFYIPISQAPINNVFRFMLFFILIGAVCGYVASSKSISNKKRNDLDGTDVPPIR